MMPRPRLYVIEDSAPNAFATGRDPQHAAIAVTTGLLAKTDREELKGVVAHELSHIRRYDIRLMAIVAVLAGTVALLADWLQRSFFYGPRRSRERGNAPLALLGFAAALLAPLAALLMQLAISRRREFLADAGSAELTRNPGALASALEKLDADSDPLEVANKATAPLYIVNPLKEHGGWLNSLFSTHPPLPERVRRLRAL
jgi:heat shock protein HtpX